MTAETVTHVHRIVVESANGTPWVTGRCACGFERRYSVSGAENTPPEGSTAGRKQSHGGWDRFQLDPPKPAIAFPVSVSARARDLDAQIKAFIRQHAGGVTSADVRVAFPELGDSRVYDSLRRLAKRQELIRHPDLSRQIGHTYYAPEEPMANG